MLQMWFPVNRMKSLFSAVNLSYDSKFCFIPFFTLLKFLFTSRIFSFAFQAPKKCCFLKNKKKQKQKSTSTQKNFNFPDYCSPFVISFLSQVFSNKFYLRFAFFLPSNPFITFILVFFSFLHLIVIQLNLLSVGWFSTIGLVSFSLSAIFRPPMSFSLKWRLSSKTKIYITYPLPVCCLFAFGQEMEKPCCWAFQFDILKANTVFWVERLSSNHSIAILGLWYYLWKTIFEKRENFVLFCNIKLFTW